MKFKIDYDGSGEHDAICSVVTASIYEEEFKSDIIADVFGKIDLTQGNVEIVTADFVEARLIEANGQELPKTTQRLINKAFPVVVSTTLDYTQDNWVKYLKALWAMLKTADEASGNGLVPGYKQWLYSVGDVNSREISFKVVDACQQGLFRPGDATNSEQ